MSKRVNGLKAKTIISSAKTMKGIKTYHEYMSTSSDAEGIKMAKQFLKMTKKKEMPLPRKILCWFGFHSSDGCFHYITKVKDNNFDQRYLRNKCIHCGKYFL